MNNEDLKNKRESSIISRNKRGSINKGGSMRQKKADINFTHKWLYINKNNNVHKSYN